MTANRDRRPIPAPTTVHTGRQAPTELRETHFAVVTEDGLDIYELGAEHLGPVECRTADETHHGRWDLEPVDAAIATLGYERVGAWASYEGGVTANLYRQRRRGNETLAMGSQVDRVCESGWEGSN